MWSPTALPIREDGQPYIARHGQGYSRFEHVSHGISLELLQFVPLEDPIKVSRLTVRNGSGRHAAIVRDRLCRMGARDVPERFRAVHRDRDRSGHEGDAGAQHLEQRLRADGWPLPTSAGRRRRGRETGRNSWGGTALSIVRRPSSARADSPGGSAPASIRAVRSRPSWSFAAGERAEVVFFLGEAATREEARAVIARYRTADLDAVLAGRRGALGRRCSARSR